MYFILAPSNVKPKAAHFCVCRWTPHLKGERYWALTMMSYKLKYVIMAKIETQLIQL